MRYERVNFLAESAEQKNDDRLIDKNQASNQRFGQGIAAILSNGNFNPPCRQTLDYEMHPDGDFIGYGKEGRTDLALATTLAPSASSKLHSHFSKTDREEATFVSQSHLKT